MTTTTATSLDTAARSSSPLSPPPDEALCLNCGYALRDLTVSRCPECGRAFDPRDSWTMNLGRPYGRIVAFLLSRTGRPTQVVACLATAAVFWWTAGLHNPMAAMVIGLSLWGVVYLYRIARAAARRIARRVYRQPKPRTRHSYVVLIVITLSGLMIWTRLPLRILFALHRPGFEHVARHHYEKMPMMTRHTPVRSRVGLYPIDIVRVDVHGAVIQTGAYSGFRYEADDELPVYYYRESVIRLGPGWYYFTSPEGYILGRPVGRALYELRRLFP